MGKVMIILGSTSDRNKMESAIWPLVGKVGVEVHAMSSHRTPGELRKLITESDADVFIAGAGMAAALPGAIAALTTKPVIGVPLSGSPLNGVDALFAIVQMPKGVPVATVAIDNAENAAILALEILGINNEKIEKAIHEIREETHRNVVKMDQEYTELVKRKIEAHASDLEKET